MTDLSEGRKTRGYVSPPRS